MRSLLSGSVSAIAILFLCSWSSPVVNAFRRLPQDVTDPVADEEASSVFELREGLDPGKRALSETPIIDDREENANFSPPHRALSPEDHLVTGLPLLDGDALKTKQYAGHLPASQKDDKYLFYWLFAPPEKHMEDAPLLIWLNGGPGCSSMDGLFLENGPLRLVYENSEWTMKINPHSWHNAPAWVLYIDQPVGTGLSFTKSKNYCKSDEAIDIDFHYFLQEFMLFHKDTFLTDKSTTVDGIPKLNRELYFSGESHAGHYIPSMIDFILQQNDKLKDTSDATKKEWPRVEIPVAGAAIGNGWVDPYHQYAAAEAAYGMGLIDLAQKSNFDSMEKECQNQMDAGSLSAGVCFGLLDDIISESHGSSSSVKVSQYDNRLWESKYSSRSFPPGHKDVETYLGGKATEMPPMAGFTYTDVLDAIHASESAKYQKFRECTDPPFMALKHQDGLGVTDEVVRILDHPSNVRLLFFNGVNDLICNHVGNEKFLDLLPWKKANKWTLAKRFSWDGGRDSGVLGPPAGYIKEYENLSFLKILESGHMVPMDQPEASLVMMQTFMSHGSFQTNAQKIERKTTSASSCDPCPTCETSETFGSEDSSTSETFVTSPGVDQGLVQQFVIASGWIGALVAVAFFMLVLYLRKRRSRHAPGAIPLPRGGEYDYDMELEMQTSGGGGSEHSSASSGYRDTPPDRMGSDVSTSSSNGII